jgi:CRISPR-associated DxTHG motif protein
MYDAPVSIDGGLLVCGLQCQVVQLAEVVLDLTHSFKHLTTV